jgi:ferrochelatase
MSSLPPSAFRPSPSSYDAILLVSFGGPERQEDVLPFLENVVRGKHAPRERLLQVAQRYDLFDGVSPINAQNRALLTALIGELNTFGLPLPVYWGNRNWHPMLVDTVQAMADDGVRHALALVTSAFGSYSSCRQYREDLASARQQVGAEAPQIDKLRLFYNHPGFIEAAAERVAAALDEIPSQRRGQTRLIYTAHSVPVVMAERSPYERQLLEACRLVTERVRIKMERGVTGNMQNREPNASKTEPFSGQPKASPSPIPWELVYQSRSGLSPQPWLGPDIRERLRQLHEEGVEDVVVVPIGFLAEHMEVVYDLDVEVGQLCDELGMNMVRAAVIGSHPRFVHMICELIGERIDPASPRLALGSDGPWPDECSAECCREP